MLLKTGTFAGMANDIIKTNSKIVIFGTGVIGSTITPQILKEYNLLDRVIFCIDNDKTRWDSYLEMFEKKVKICSPDVLEKTRERMTVLITISRYSSAVEQLTNFKCSDYISCYIIPALCLNNYHSTGGKGVIKTSEEKLIPKRIHYIWLGKSKIPEKLERCMESWKHFCPDYEIVRWDESNYDVYKNKFVSQSYSNKKYGFVTDYAKLELLYDYGGIFLDTDVELKRNIDDLLYQESFCSVEKWQVVNFGGCSGAVKGHKSLIPFLEKWANRSIVREDGTLDNLSSGLIDTSIAIEHGYVINGKTQTVNGMNIYTYDYFHPYDYMTGKIEMTNDTFSIHHFNGGWLDEKAKQDNINTTNMYEDFMKTAIDVG